MPPENVWDPIQAIRKDHDKAYKRWMPHVNLIYPFIESVHFKEVIDSTKHALSAIRPFSVRMEAFNHFAHKGSCTMWLHPKTQNKEILELQSILEQCFPYCDDLGMKSDTGFTPHLSVGQWNKQTVKDAQKQFQDGWQPIEFDVSCVYFISRKGFEDPFRIHYKVPFLPDQPVEKLVDDTPQSTSNEQGEKHIAFVSNLAFSIDEERLSSTLQSMQLNPIKVDIVKKNGRSKGFGFAEFNSAEDLQKAIQTANEVLMEGRRIVVTVAKKDTS